MRNVIVRLIAFITLITVASCKKDDLLTPAPPITTQISSMLVHDLTSHSLASYSFTIDSLNRLKKYIYSYHDSAAASPMTVTYQWVFSYKGGDTLPSFYRRNSRAANILQYDARGRIIKDSIVQDGTYSLTTINVFYQDDNHLMTIEKVIPPTIGHYIDTLAMSNGNVQRASYWFRIPSLSAFHSDNAYTYTSYVNPLARFRVFGPSFFYENEADCNFLSKNLFSKLITEDGSCVINWTADSHGRVVRGEEIKVSGGTTWKRIIEFKYQ